MASSTSEIGSIKRYRCALNYRQQTRFREDNVFTGVCLSTGDGWVGGYVFNDDNQVSVVGVGMSMGEYVQGDWVSMSEVWDLGYPPHLY